MRLLDLLSVRQIKGKALSSWITGNLFRLKGKKGKGEQPGEGRAVSERHGI